MVLRLRGGGFAPLTFNNLENEIKGKGCAVTNETPKHITFSPGLNLVGICKTSSCVAFNKESYHEVGFGVHNLPIVKTTA